MKLALELDLAPLTQAITKMPDILRELVMEASRITAENIVREAKGRLARQLGPGATGATVAGIEAKVAYDGNGYVVLADRDPFPQLPLWIERGTKPGKRRNFARTIPRPFFYPSIELEAGSHERRILQAMRDAAQASGLGE